MWHLMLTTLSLLLVTVGKHYFFFTQRYLQTNRYLAMKLGFLNIFHCCTRGYTFCSKLSPNLRRPSKEYQMALINGETKCPRSCEARKLQRLLAMVQEPDELSNVEANADDEDETTKY